MTDTTGKIEQLTSVKEYVEEMDDLHLAYMVGCVKGRELANKNAIERVAKWLCIQHDEDPISDGYENWKKYIPRARDMLGVW